MGGGSVHLTSRCRGIRQHLGPSSDFVAGSTRPDVYRGEILERERERERRDGRGGVVRGESESETEEQTLPIPQHDTSPWTGHSS